MGLLGVGVMTMADGWDEEASKDDQHTKVETQAFHDDLDAICLLTLFSCALELNTLAIYQGWCMSKGPEPRTLWLFSDGCEPCGPWCENMKENPPSQDALAVEEMWASGGDGCAWCSAFFIFGWDHCTFWGSFIQCLEQPSKAFFLLSTDEVWVGVIGQFKCKHLFSRIFYVFSCIVKQIGTWV